MITSKNHDFSSNYFLELSGVRLECCCERGKASQPAEKEQVMTDQIDVDHRECLQQENVIRRPKKFIV